MARLSDTSPLDLVQKSPVMIHEDDDGFDEDGDLELEHLLRSEHSQPSPARIFLMNQQKSLTKVRHRLETNIRSALFQNC